MLIYLHGLNSSHLSRKAQVLRERLAPIPVMTPSYPAHRPDAAVASLAAIFEGLAQGPPPVVVGSSMGGFYGQYLARRFAVAHLFMINPALLPWELFRDHLGTSQTTDSGDTYVVDQAMIEATRKYGIAVPCDGVPTTLLLDKGDEVIDYRIAEALYRDCARLLVFDGGDHGFQHLEESMPAIRAALAGHG